MSEDINFEAEFKELKDRFQIMGNWMKDRFRKVREDIVSVHKDVATLTNEVRTLQTMMKSNDVSTVASTISTTVTTSVTTIIEDRMMSLRGKLDQLVESQKKLEAPGTPKKV